jgi:DNA repair exonuclease SbcCD nuclease subunit
MFRFIHSADWQLGARFSQFGAKGSALREARLTTLRRALDLARQKSVDAFLVAGDLFEDNQVDEALVSQVVGMFSDYHSLPIYLLPGNHDPFTGPDSVWQRRSFAKASGHIHVLTRAESIDLGGVWLLASPLQQKLSTVDPSLKLVDLATTVPTGAIKVGITHGALAIEGKHQPNDFPIALNAASRAGLDYLAVGHWHNWLPDTDSGRLVMPGTPEPDQFDQDRSGRVAFVEIDAPGIAPRVEALQVATLDWKRLTFDFLLADASRTSLTHALSSLAANAMRTVLRVELTGTASPAQLAEVRTWLEGALSPFLVGQLFDRSSIALTAAELVDLQSRHPILAQVLADLDQIEMFATGAGGPQRPLTDTTLTLSEAQRLLAQSKIELTALNAEHLTRARQVLLQTMQEVSP